MADNFYQVKKTIDGVEYTAQFNGVAAALDATDASYINVDGVPAVSNRKLAEYIFSNVIVNPKVSVNDFTSVTEMNKVAEFGQQVMQGDFRKEKNEGGATEKNKG